MSTTQRDPGEDREPRLEWEHLMLVIRGQDAWRRWREEEPGGSFESFARAHPDEAREIREALEEWSDAPPRHACLVEARVRWARFGAKEEGKG